MKIERIEINKLKPATYNPRQISTKQYKDLEESIDKFGLVDPIIVNKDMTIIGGHQRYKIWAEKAKQSSIDDITIPCVVLELNKEQERELNIRLNKSGGEWDMDILANEFDVEELKDWGFKDIEFGFNIDKIIEGNTEDDHIPEAKESRVKVGDIWELGNHRLMCGDSTKESDVEKLMNGEKADMVFTDPPYKIETKGGYKSEIGKGLKKQGQDIDFISNFNPKEFLKILPSVFERKKINSYIFCNKELLPDYLNWARENNFSFNVLIWKKPNAIPIRDSHRPDIEYLLLFRKCAIWNNGLNDVNYSRCLEYGRENGLHPTMKPIELITNEIKISSNKNSICVDLFLGSGSTLIACEKTNRICYGMELDTKYCDVIIERWEQFTGQKANKITE